MPTIALIGDHSPAVTAHRAIPRALELAGAGLGAGVKWEWIATDSAAASATNLADFDAIWVVPGSPYRRMSGALEAIRFARESGRPFLGTCGGFQHALIEVARNVAGITAADHAESNPAADTPVVALLSCALVETRAVVNLAPDTLIRAAYRRTTIEEGYRCSYGLNSRYRDVLQAAGLRFTAFDPSGEIRAAELPRSVHPFFVGTLFQPERAALAGAIPPIVSAFVAQAVRHADPRPPGAPPRRS